MPEPNRSEAEAENPPEAPRRSVGALLLESLGLVLLLAGTAAALQAGDRQTSPIKKLGPHLYRVGTIELDAGRRTIRCPGRVNMDAGGPIELLACLPTGKTHESVFTLDVEPMHLKVALLLLGMREGRNPAYPYPEGDPEGNESPGETVQIDVEWERADDEEGRKIRRPAGNFLYNVQAESALQDAEWVFLGSRQWQGRFGAESDGSLITTYHDPLAILELAHPTVRDDIYYFVNEELCPPVDTPVELIIRAPESGHTEKEEQADVG